LSALKFGCASVGELATVGAPTRSGLIVVTPRGSLYKILMPNYGNVSFAVSWRKFLQVVSVLEEIQLRSAYYSMCQPLGHSSLARTSNEWVSVFQRRARRDISLFY
jgi:hypothetical protein